MISKAITAFTAGELSPWLDGRHDVEKYHSGCRKLENFLLTPYGGVRRRPGTAYVAAQRDETATGRLIPFRYSTSATYILVFSGGYIDIYDGGTAPSLVASLDVATATGTAAYAAADLFRIQYAQQNDVMYLTHPSYPVRKLTRTSATTFTIADVAFEWAPMRDQNTTEAVTVQATSAAGTDRYAAGSTVTIAGVGTAWTSAMVGSRMRIQEERPGTDFEVSLAIPAVASAAQSSEIQIQGGWQLTVVGDWYDGLIQVQEYDVDAAAWVTIRELVTEDENRSTGVNLTVSGTQSEVTRMRIARDANAIANNSGQAILEASDSEDPFGEVEITAFTNGTTLTATVKKRLYLSPQIAGYPDSANTNTTSLWSDGAFSGVAGYPAAVTFHEGRLVFGGTTLDAQTIWGSVSDDYENFRTGTDDDESYRHALAAQEHNAIRWMVSERRLIIGTSGGEFVVGSADDSVIVTPSNVRARRHSNFGSDTIQALLINDAVIYAERHGRRIREYGYSFERDRYQAADLTILAEHITDTGIKELAFQQQREAVLWAVTEGGNLIGLTYEREQGVSGWHCHTTGSSDTFESVETIYGEDEEDEVWVLVKRTVNGATRRFIERIEPTQYETQKAGTKSDFWYVDSGLSSSGSSLTSITLPHLPSTVVAVIADGVEQAPITTSATGVAALTSGLTASKITAGLPMTSRLEPMKLEVGLPNGTARSREGRIHRVGMSVWQSMGGEFGPTAIGTVSGLNLDPILYRSTDDGLDASPDVYTGELELDCDFDYVEGVTIGIVTDSVYPLSVLMLVPKLRFFGDEG